MHIKKTALLIILLLCPVFLFATGPSHMYIRIYPVSINQNNDILCIVESSYNPMGAQAFMPVEYEWLVIESKGSLKQYPWCNWDPYTEYRDYDKSMEEKDLIDSYISSPIDFSNPFESLNGIIEEYNFTENNISQYIIDTQYDYNEFFSEYDYLSDNFCQRTINNNRSVSRFSSIEVKYDFPTCIISSNRISNYMYDEEINNVDFGIYASGSQRWSYDSSTIYAVIMKSSITIEDNDSGIDYFTKILDEENKIAGSSRGSFIYPIAWSRDGKFAYLKEFQTYDQNMNVYLEIQDMVTDEIVYSQEINSDSIPNISGVQLSNFEIYNSEPRLFIAYVLSQIHLQTSLFNNNGIDLVIGINDSEIADFPLSDGVKFSYIVDGFLDGDNQSVHNIFVYRYDYSTKSWESKQIGTLNRLMYEDIERFTYLISPFENRIAIIVTQILPDMSANQTLFGSHLDVGFSSTNIDSNNTPDGYLEVMNY